MTQQYLSTPISLGQASKKYSIPVQTLSRWAAHGRIKILVRPELRGQKMLVDEFSVMLARQAYIPYWRQGEPRPLPLPLDVPVNPGLGGEGGRSQVKI